MPNASQVSVLSGESSHDGWRNPPRWVLTIVNLVALIGQAGTLVALVLMLALDCIDFKLPLTQHALFYDEDNGLIELREQTWGTFEILWIIIGMIALTCLSHTVALVPPLRGLYLRYGENGVNVFFVEYSVTASLMMTAILLLSGVWEIVTAAALGFMFFAVNLGGLAIELQLLKLRKRYGKLPGDAFFVTTWIPFAVLSVLALLPWAVWTAYFVASVVESGELPPWWLFFAFVATFVWFNAFAFVFAAQRLSERFGWLGPRFFMLNYVFLSLGSKLNLTWFIIMAFITGPYA